MDLEINVQLLLKQKSPAKIASYIFNKYMRVYPAEPLDVLIEKIRNKPFIERIKEAQNSIFPEVLLALSEDVDLNVREEVYKNEFWQLIGRYYEIIDFPRAEKLKLIEDEDLFVLLTFLLFEKDLVVLRKVLEHPLLSLQMLLDFEKVLKKRGFGLEDQKLLALTGEVIRERKTRFHKVSRIHAARQKERPKDILTLLEYLLDQDPTIRKSALNALENIPVKKLLTILSDFPVVQKFFKTSIYRFLSILEILYHDFKPAIQLKEFLTTQDFGPKTQKLEEAWKQVIEKIGGDLLQHLETEMTEHYNLVAIANAHISSIPAIRKVASDILALEDIFALIMDEQFPRRVGKQIVEILQKHSDPDIKKRVEEYYFSESERLRKKLKELEISINAYFDIIFDMLGYPKIYEIRQKLKLLDQAFRLFEEFFARQQKSDFVAKKGFFQVYHGLIKDYQFQLERIYQDISEKSLGEVEDLFEMLNLIFDAKESFIREEVSSYGDESEEEEKKKIIHQAELIWKSSISQYLGRIKELDDMLRHKWVFMIHREEGEEAANELKEEIKLAIQQMEMDHKNKVKCTLPITCRVCQKRNCASERFINQVEFFTSEFIQYIKSAKE